MCCDRQHEFNSGSAVLNTYRCVCLIETPKNLQFRHYVRQTEHSLNLDSGHLNSNLKIAGLPASNHTSKATLIRNPTMGKPFPQVQPGGSLILAWRIKDKNVLVVGGGEVRLFAFRNPDVLNGYTSSLGPWRLGKKGATELTNESIDRLRLAAFSAASMPMPKLPSSAPRPG